MIKIDQFSVDGDIGWVFGVNTFTEPHLLRSGEAADAYNVTRAAESAAWNHRPAFLHVRFTWGEDVDRRYWEEGGPLQGTACAYDSDTHYAVRGGRVFSFTPNTWGIFAAKCVTPQKWLKKKGQVWVTGVPKGVIVNDGRNLPVFARQTYATQSGTNVADIRVGQAGVYTQGRFFYVTMDGRSILASDLDNPTSMQEALDTNVYGWNAPEADDAVVALARHRVLNNTVEVGDLVFSTGSNIYTVDTRGARESWSTTQLGRVSVAIPDVAFAGPRAAAGVNSNLIFRAAQPGLNLCMFNQLSAQFEKADAFSGQFLEADAWLKSDGQALQDWTVVQSYGSRVLVTAGPRIGEDGAIHHHRLLAFEAIKGTDEGLRFQGVWIGPRVLDMSVATRGHHRGVIVWGLTDTGSVDAWSLVDGMSHDTNHLGLPKPIQSAVVTRGFVHQSAFQAKQVVSQGAYIRDACGTVDLQVAHRLDTHGEWKSVRTRSVTGQGSTTIGPINFGMSSATGDTPGIPGGMFFAEQILIAWTGQAALSGVSTKAQWRDTPEQDAGDPVDGMGDIDYDPLTDRPAATKLNLDFSHL